MTAPGSRLRAWLATRCSHRTMRAIVDPAIADIRFALAGAAIVLPLLGLASPSRQRRGWVALGAGAFGICATYYALLWVAEYAVRNEGAPVVAMWCPNLVVGAGAALLLITERPRDNDGCLLPGSEP